MSRKKFIRKLEFKEQTPDILLREEKDNLLYEKAFLLREDILPNEYAQNTTTWD